MDDLQSSIERGRGYLRHGMWDDAIRELEGARALAPDATDLAVDLAKAYEGRWRNTDYPEDKRIAATIARECVERDPASEEAFALLARLSGNPAAPATDPGVRNRKVAIIPLVVGAGLALIGLAVTFMFSTEPNFSTHPPMIPEPPVPQIARPDAPDVPPRPIPEPTDAQLPITLVENEFSSDLKFSVRKSRLDVYPESAFYRLWAAFEVTGAAEVTEIDVSLELLDGESVVSADSWQALASHEAKLRPGDTAVFEHLVRAKPEVDAARLTVTKVEKSLAPSTYPASKPVELRWVVTKPAGVALEVRERSAGTSGGDYFRAEWEFTNEGTGSLENVKYEVRLFDAAGKLIDQTQRLVTYNSAAPMEPGETRVESTIRDAPGYDHYEIAVIQAD